METPPRLTSSLPAQLSDKRTRRKSSIVSTGLGRQKHRCLFSEEESEGVSATVMKKTRRWVDLFHSLSNFFFFVKVTDTNLFFALFNTSVLTVASVSVLLFSCNTSSLPFPVSASFFLLQWNHILHLFIGVLSGPQEDLSSIN